MSLFTTVVAFCILSRALPCWVAGWFPTFRTCFMFPSALHCFLGVWIAPCQLLGIVFMRFPTLEVHHIHRCLASTRVNSQTSLFLLYCLWLSGYCDSFCKGEFLLGCILPNSDEMPQLTFLSKVCCAKPYSKLRFDNSVLFFSRLL